MRVALYARISKKDQNLEIQLAALEKYVAYHNYHVVAVYTDTVTGNVTKREAKGIKTRYDDLMADAEAGMFDCVVVIRYDRFGRSFVDLINALRTFRRLNIRFVAVAQQVDTSTPSGELLFNMLASISQFERELISERTTAALKHAKARGVILGRKEKEATKAIKVEVLNRYHRGETFQSIATAHQLPLPTVYSIIKRNVVPCEHGKYRCKHCRQSLRVAKRLIAAGTRPNLGKNAQALVGSERMGVAHQG
jgi:DNA invertase Pin-like site-specific DNA recombinase